MLYMGCDFYIIKYLQITFLDDDDAERTLYLELYRERGYFNNSDYYNSDSDSDDSENSDILIKKNPFLKELYIKEFEKYLKSSYKPKIIFENLKWFNKIYQKKYEKLIYDHIENGLLLNVVKKEHRKLA